MIFRTLNRRKTTYRHWLGEKLTANLRVVYIWSVLKKKAFPLSLPFLKSLL